jgi:hypothetical protein
MSEWLILVLLVPAIAVPVVLLVGFAGCDFHTVAVSDAPIIDSAIGDGINAITLTWHLNPNDDATAAHTFEIERTRPNNQPDPLFEVPDSPLEDTNLPTSQVDPGTGTAEVYKYRVRRVRSSNGDRTGWSDPVSSPTFLATFGGDNFLVAGSGGPFTPGFCVIQRFEPSELLFSGTKVQIVLRGSPTGTLAIDRIYISQAGGTKPYDAGPDLTPLFTTPFVIAADQVLTRPVIDYTLDRNQPLLIAFDLTPASPASLRVLDLPQPPPGPGSRCTLVPPLRPKPRARLDPPITAQSPTGSYASRRSEWEAD